MSSKLLTRIGDGRNEIVWDNYDVTRIITPPTFKEGKFQDFLEVLYNPGSSDRSILSLLRSPTSPPSDTTTVRLDDQTDGSPIYAFVNPDKTSNRHIAYYCESEKIYLPSDCTDMFSLDNLSDLDITGWDFSKVTNMNYMFDGISSATLDLSSVDLSNVTQMIRTFQYATAKINISNSTTNKLTTIAYMFYASTTSTLNIENLDTSNVTNMNSVFRGRVYNSPSGSYYDDLGISNLVLKNFSTRSLTNCSYMFADYRGLQTLDISNWTKITDINCENMFDGCANLTTIICTSEIEQWIRNNATTMAIPNIDNITFNRP